MSLIKCPECNEKVSTSAEICPHCGYRLNNNSAPKQFETKTVSISYWSKSGLNEKLNAFIQDGWEIVAVKDAFWRSGALRHVSDVVLKRSK